MENTKENKAKFFAQYIWQKVYTHIEYDGEIIILDSLFLNPKDKVFSDGYYLELTPLSHITDEDAEFLGYSDAKSATTTLYKVLGPFTKDSDYLRSKGYALPWMGLEVEQLIEYGWVKLKEN